MDPKFLKAIEILLGRAKLKHDDKNHRAYVEVSRVDFEEARFQLAEYKKFWNSFGSARVV